LKKAYVQKSTENLLFIHHAARAYAIARVRTSTSWAKRDLSGERLIAPTSLVLIQEEEEKDNRTAPTENSVRDIASAAVRL
jgi:hypothetical protein